jgi:hypothetical protein
MSWKGVFALSGALLAVGLLPTVASAAKPIIERIPVDDAGPEPELTAACGFPVEVVATGHVILRTFEDDGKGLVSLTTLNVRIALTANGNTVRLHDVGSDQVRITPDGTVILSIIGQIPFETDFTATGFHGVLKVNLGTGEVIHEPQHTTGSVETVCATLAA